MKFGSIGRFVCSAMLVCGLVPSAAWAEVGQVARGAGSGTGSGAGGNDGPTETISGDYASDEIIVVYDNATTDDGIQTFSTFAVEEALNNEGMAVEETIADASDSYGTMVVASTGDASVEDAIEAAEEIEGVAYAQPNYVYRLLEDSGSSEDYEADLTSDAVANYAASGATNDNASSDSAVSGAVSATASPDMLFSSSAVAESVPDDPAAGVVGDATSITNGTANQYYLYGEVDTDGDGITDIKGADVMDAWNYVTNDQLDTPVTVAVLDTGCNLKHEDLQGRLWTDYAWDTYNNKKLEPSGTFNGDYYGHGTHVSGIIAATANNATGIAGASYNGKVLPIKVFTDSTSNPGAYTSDIVEAYNYLLELVDEHGDELNLHAVNMSLGSYGSMDSTDKSLEALIVKAMSEDYNILTVCAGGNGDDYGNPYTKAQYPSDFAESFSVTALTYDGTNCTWSDFNANKNISAPGYKLYSTYHSGTASYKAMSGTSMASPLVAGIASLLWVADPSATVEEVWNALTETATAIDDSGDSYRRNSTGYNGTVSGSAGAINAEAAVKKLADAQIVAPDDVKNVYRTQQVTFGVTLTESVAGESASDLDWTWSVENGTGEATIASDGTLTAVSAGSVVVKVEAPSKIDPSRTYSATRNVLIKEIQLESNAGPWATQGYGDAVTVTWNAATCATDYLVQRASSATGTFETVGTVAASSDPTATLTFADSTAAVSTVYFYRIVPRGTLNGQQVEGAVSGTVSGLRFATVNSYANQAESAAQLNALNTVAGVSIDTVVVVGNEDATVAVAAAGLAGTFGAAYVATSPSALDDDAKAAIQMYNPVRVIAVGDTTDLSEAAYKEIEAAVPTASINRYSAGAANSLCENLYSQGRGSWGSTAIVVGDTNSLASALGTDAAEGGVVSAANLLQEDAAALDTNSVRANTVRAEYHSALGQEDPAAALDASTSTGALVSDLLSVGTYAYAADAPVFTTNAAGKLSVTTRQNLNAGNFARVIIVGGTDEVSADVESQLTKLGMKFDRVQADNPYALSALLAEDGYEQGVFSGTTRYFAKADLSICLSAISLTGATKEPLLLVDTNAEDTLETFAQGTPESYGSIAFFDGEKPLTDAEKTRIEDYAKGDKTVVPVKAGEATPTVVSKPSLPVASGLVYNGKEQTGVSAEAGAVYVLSGNVGTNAGDYTAVVSLPNTTDYVWSDGTTDPVSVTWSIAKAPATITVANASMTAGGSVPALTGAVEGLVDASDLGAVTYVLESGADTSKAGTYKIIASYTANANYEVAVTEGTLTVTASPTPDPGPSPDPDPDPDPGTTVDKSALTAAITAAGAAKEGVSVSTDGSDVPTTEMWVKQATLDALNSAIEDAQKVADSADATQSEVDTAAARLSTATILFESAKSAGTKVDPGPAAATVERVSGNEAENTAVAISQQSYADGSCKTVIIANDRDFMDSMSATGLAGSLDAPILLVNADTGVYADVAAEIARLRATKAYIIGGPNAVTTDVEAQLREAGVTSTMRVYGNEAWDTSVACANEIADVNGKASEYAIVARSDNFQDALSMSSFAYAYKVPIILAPSEEGSAASSLPEGGQSILSAATTQVFVAGGTGAIAESTVADVSNVKRLGGTDGFDTSNQIANYMAQADLLSAETVCVASGASNPKGTDALAGAALAGKAGGVMLLANTRADFDKDGTTSVATITGTDHEGNPAFLEANASDVQNVYVLGGVAVMPEALFSQIEGVVAAK